MTAIREPRTLSAADSARIVRDHLWMHFTPHSAATGAEVPVIVRGEGAYIYDSAGRRYLDGLAGLFAVQVGHGREELAEAAARQTRELAYFPIWGYAHPTALELAERLAIAAPGDLNRVFFTVSGGESVETAWKLIRQYFKLTGKPTKHKVISRSMAYHGTSMGALSITGIPGAKADFEPLVPSTQRVPNTNFYRATEHTDDYEAYGRWAADRIEEAILFEGADTVAAVFLEPVQNTGGCFVPPPGYFQRVREICDRHDVLLVSDEVICAFGRLGYDFGAKKFGYQPDIITTAKGLTSGYAPLGAVMVSDRIAEAFQHGATFMHGSTYGGHPVSCAVALANLDLMEREDLYGHVLRNEQAFKSTLEKLYDIPIVGEVRGDGYFWAVELVKDRATKERFTDEDGTRILKGHVSAALFEAGLHCRADDRAEPVIQLAPPLICDQRQFDEMEHALRFALTGAAKLL
ncbi:aspartate aminotransferase family protein [Nocardia uniformis]|uniref:Aspartate aminotransferase family protein n=1 Tax=Nocardia uniformis TaxID=53432 RepID=A0A849BVD6_9NOCA|nr:aspartate aminotransferase family protein [Nocardia uniformis]NNH70522.1 aspartate aminotransferase family protein [Nocardia uniformis]